MITRKKTFYRFLAALALLAILLHSSAYAGNGIKLIGYGPIQRAMGGASVGLPLDANTVITNPAGMHEVGKRVDLGLTLAVASARYNATSTVAVPAPRFAPILEDGATLISDTDPMLIPAVGITFPFNKYIAAGLGLHGTSGVEIKYKRNLYGNITYVEYKCMQVTPALSFSFKDVFSFGVAAAINYATLDYEAAGVAQRAHRNGSAWGGGYILSMLVKPFNALPAEVLPAEIPKDLLSVGLTYQSEQAFAPFEYDTDHFGRDKLQLNQPRTLTFGFGVKPDKKLRMALDIEWIGWNHVLGGDQPEYRENRSNAATWNVDWNNQVVYKLGAEYDILENVVVEKVMLRAGYNYGKHPLKKDRPFEGIALPAITEHHITCGLGVDLTKNISFSAAFMYAPKIKHYMTNPRMFLDDVNITTYAWSLDAGLSLKF